MLTYGPSGQPYSWTQAVDWSGGGGTHPSLQRPGQVEINLSVPSQGGSRW